MYLFKTQIINLWRTYFEFHLFASDKDCCNVAFLKVIELNVVGAYMQLENVCLRAAAYLLDSLMAWASALTLS